MSSPRLYQFVRIQKLATTTLGDSKKPEENYAVYIPATMKDWYSVQLMQQDSFSELAKLQTKTDISNISSRQGPT